MDYRKLFLLIKACEGLTNVETLELVNLNSKMSKKLAAEVENNYLQGQSHIEIASSLRMLRDQFDRVSSRKSTDIQMLADFQILNLMIEGCYAITDLDSLREQLGLYYGIILTVKTHGEIVAVEPRKLRQGMSRSVTADKIKAYSTFDKDWFLENQNKIIFNALLVLVATINKCEVVARGESSF